MTPTPRATIDALLALREGMTPGPWWSDGKYDGREMGCAVLAARTDCGPLPGNPTRGLVAFASAILNTEARRCEANARAIAALPDILSLLATVAAERDAAVEALINIETAPTSYSSETLRRLARNTLTTIAAAQASAAKDEGE
jgi:hypothetical protein